MFQAKVGSPFRGSVKNAKIFLVYNGTDLFSLITMLLLFLWLHLLFLRLEEWHETIFQIYATNLIKLG